MIYRIECETSGTVYAIADSSVMEALPVLDPVLEESLNGVPQLTFAIPMTHPNREQILPLMSVIRLYIDGQLAFAGRALSPEYDWLNTAHYTCEGCLAYLNDSIMRPYGLSGTPAFILGQILTAHNSQVEAKKQIQLGTVDVGGGIAIDNTDFSTCMEAVEKVIELSAGYLRIRVSGGVTYLDFVTEYATANTQPIRFGENLLDLKKYQSAENIKTALIPLGATLDDGAVVDITSVNNGIDYIYNQAAVDAYGWLWATMTWDAIETPAALLATAQDYLAELCALPETVEVSAVDLSAINVDIERFKLGGATTMISVPHGISKTAVLTERTLHLSNPAQDSITIGTTTKEKTLTGQNVAAVRKATTTAENNASSASRFSQFVSGGLGGYVMLDYDNDGDPKDRELPYRILIMDTADKATATYVLQLNKDGIGFSSNGVNGDYYNSWTIDGQLSLGGTDNAYGALQILDPTGTVIGKWSKDGIVVKQGVIDLLRGTGKIGLYVDGAVVQLGDFEINDKYGRQVIQSIDEMTGISGEPQTAGGLYLWTGWESDNIYKFVVNKTDAYVRVSTPDGYQTYAIGTQIYRLWQKIAEIEEELDPDPPTP